jgi:hypothetical protein
MRSRAGDADRLAVQLEPIHILDGLERRLLAVEHDKGLPFALQAALGNHVQDRSVVRENAPQRFLEHVDGDALFEVVDLWAGRLVWGPSAHAVGSALRRGRGRASAGTQRGDETHVDSVCS